MRGNGAHTLLLVFFVSVMILILSTNDAIAHPPPPDANAGANQTVTEGVVVTLNGTTTHDPGGGLKFQWSYHSGALDDPLTVNEAKQADAEFTAGDVDEDTVLEFQLIVSHQNNDSDPVFMNVTITNAVPATLPVANAGANQTVTKGDTVILNGTNSTGDDITFKWTYDSGAPPKSPFKGKNAANDTSATPTFTADAKKGGSVLIFSLTVTNGSGTDTDVMNVTVADTDKFNFVPGKDGEKKSKGLGSIITGKAFGIKIDKPGAIVSGFLKQLVVNVNVNGEDVVLDFTQSSKVPPGLALPDIVTALFLDLNFTGIDLTQESSFPDNTLPIMQFEINSNFESSGRFVDGCPVMSLQLLDEDSGAWGAVGNPNTANTNKIYVSNTNGTLAVIDGSTNNLVDTITVGTTSKLMSFDTSANRVYAVNEGDGTVSVINTAGDVNNVIATIAVGTAPIGVTVNESTDRLYVTNKSNNTVSVINTANDVNTVIPAITVGTEPNGVAVNESTDRLYVTNKVSNTVSVINTANDANNVIATIDVGTAPSSVAVNESGDRVYVANKSDGTVSVIDTDSTSGTFHTVIDTISVQTNPTGLSFNPTVKKLYVANSGSGTVSIIDTELGDNIANVTTGAGASDVEANPNTNRIFVANSGAGTVSVIDGMLGTATEDTVIDTITGFTNNFGIALNPAIPNPVRDPSADVYVDGEIDQCAYIATPPHFSRFAIGGTLALAVASLVAGGGGGSSGSSFGDGSVASFGDGSGGFGVILSDTNQNLLEDSEDPVALSTGEKNVFRFDLAQNRGINSVLHVTAYFNLRGDDFTVQESDAYITFEKGRPLLIVDPNGYFSEVDFKILERDATNLVLKYEITFAKPMEESHILLRTWDHQRASSEKLLTDALIVELEKETTTDESGILSDESELQETEISAEAYESLDKVRAELNEAKIPDWIKTSAGWWSERAITDIDFTKGIEHLIKNDIMKLPPVEVLQEQRGAKGIPDWVKSTAGWWSDGLLSDEEFVNGIQWLIKNGVIII